MSTESLVPVRLHIPGALEPTSLSLPVIVGFDEWLEVGRTLATVERGHLWWLGDWWNHGQRQYGDMASREAKDRVSEATGRAFKTIKNAGAVASSFEKSRRRDNLDWSHHAEVAALPEAEQDAWLDLTEAHDWSQRELRKRLKRGLPEPTGVVLILPPDVDLRLGDFREALGDIPDDSIDAIITDPPYPREYLPLYEGLAELAARVLVPGGSLVCMVGQSYLPDVLGSLTRHLRYHWTASYLAFGPHTVIWDREVLSGWKPILWLTKGAYDGHQVFDVFTSEAAEKKRHEWRQSESGVAALVERFTDDGEMVLDPFLGTGTTGAVCRALGRRFIGCESDPETFAIARERLQSEAV